MTAGPRINNAYGDLSDEYSQMQMETALAGFSPVQRAAAEIVLNSTALVQNLCEPEYQHGDNFFELPWAVVRRDDVWGRVGCGGVRKVRSRCAISRYLARCLVPWANRCAANANPHHDGGPRLPGAARRGPEEEAA